jgi:hypothetical protein
MCVNKRLAATLRVGKLTATHVPPVEELLNKHQPSSDDRSGISGFFLKILSEPDLLNN